uniref:Uncharacterized protein n=1 Tax=Pseudo-nitzschia australis TaxID=44445 RepID=A0A6V0BUQ8_9STRA|mmetsp:Transcript_17126/g.37459  ORF Transcript_17126/g.37459 Transcript_17126/m.37459 type:complete len:197 (-) Transcript_17126:192-782(-)|eukprot:CAMPEP_0168204490 /NCGR_PEP_ID=MMETSP0139_2-20121125/25421_1 /TAXON_ID=44445 /ORGANISM="Pseudo-nitzschia australis, Strain 10249 10 AB" /LENGTH=196 /DNA_ID=CAMNT_0008130423 /DNA_START=498 /DNA_END=1088 /DNA_ORIENTATION=-
MLQEKTCVKKAATAKHKTTGAGSKTAKRLTASSQNILNIIAAVSHQMNSTEVNRSLLAMQAKIAVKSLNNTLSKLKQKGLVTLETGASVSITPGGIEQADIGAIKICKTNREHHQNTMETFKLRPKQRLLFAELSDGCIKTKKNVLATIGQTSMKSFQNMLMPLKKMGILAYDKDTVWLTDAMFVIEGRTGSNPCV